MDYHNLTRRQLQALCKRNKIPANITNVATADALTFLEYLEGIEEFLNPCESETANSSMVSPEKSEKVSGSVPRTLTRTRGRTRGKTTRDVDETKIEMVETPAKPTTRTRAAATLVRPKLETSMKDCELKEHIGDQIEMEKKEAPKTPAAVHASRRRDVKAKSSVRPVYSTRRSARLAVKTSSESSRQEKETLEAITYDSLSEAVDEKLEVDSKQCSIHQNEELDKNGIDLKELKESLDTSKDSEFVSGQDSHILAENQLEVEGGVKDSIAVDVLRKEAEKGLEVEESYHSINAGELDVSEDNKELTGEKKDKGVDVAGDDSDEENNNAEEDQNDDIIFECEVDDGTEYFEEAGGELMGQKKEKRDDVAEEDHSDEFFESEIDDGTKSNSDGAGELDVPGANIELTGEELMDKFEVVYDEANVDVTAKVEFAEGEEPIEKLEINAAKAGLVVAAHLPVASSMPNAASKSVSTSPSSSRTAKPFLITEKSRLTPVKKSSSKTPMKKSMSKTLVATRIAQMHVSDDKENIDYSGRKLVLTKEKLKKNRSNADNYSNQSLNDLSLRQLTKVLKDLQISKDPNKKDTTNTKAASSRPALQTLPETRLMS